MIEVVEPKIIEEYTKIRDLFFNVWEDIFAIPYPRAVSVNQIEFTESFGCIHEIDFYYVDGIVRYVPDTSDSCPFEVLKCNTRVALEYGNIPSSCEVLIFTYNQLNK